MGARGWQSRASILLVVAFCALVAAAPAGAADQSVARQIDAGHTGFASGGSLDRPPLQTRWSRELGTRQSYPLIAGGRVFAVHYEPDKASATLSALSATTGATLWTRPIGGGSTLAYDAGRVYALDSGGQVTAFDAAEGRLLWSRVVQEPFDDTTPVAAGGVVYVYLSWSGGALRALDGETGEILWSNSALWSGGSPAVDGENVYVHDDYDCATAAVDRQTGRSVWTVAFDCWLGGTEVAANGAFVLTGAGQLLDSGTGALRDGLYGGPPAIAGTTLLQLNGKVLQARNAENGLTRWEFKGDGKLSGPPVIVNHVAYIGSSSGVLFGVDLHTGAQVWSSTLGVGTCTSYCSTPPAPGAPGMAVGEGLLLVPVGGKLVALEDAATLPTAGLDLEITAGPDGPTADDDASFTYSATGAGFTYECRLDGGAWLPCDGSTELSDLAVGPHSFEVKTVGAGGDVALAARGWSVTGSPRTVILAAPAEVSNRSTASFTLSASNAVRTECRLDGGTWTTCGRSVSYSVSNGSHVFEARSIGGSGEIEDPPVSHRWTVDTTVPDTSISSGPEGTVSSRSARFTFSSPEAGARFECSLDGDAFAACTSPANYENLEDGEHRFRVRAADAAGNVDATPAQRTWSVSILPAPPDTSISTGPATRTRSHDAHFRFAASPSDGATFECRLDAGAWTACASPRDMTVDEGTHRFDVRARGEGGPDPTPASWAWTVDSTPPETTMDEGDTGPSGESGYRLAFTASDGAARFRCRLDGGTWDSCTSPVVYGALTPGPHVFEVVARDTVGNEDGTPATWEFSIDEPEPEPTPAGSDADVAAGGTATTESRTGDATRESVPPAPPASPGTPPVPAAEPPRLVTAPAPASPRAFAQSVVDAVGSLRPADARAGAQLMMPFAAPRAGVLRVVLVAKPRRREVVAGRGVRRFRGAGAAIVRVRLTRAGRRLLARRRSVPVVARATWVPARGSRVRGAARARR